MSKQTTTTDRETAFQAAVDTSADRIERYAIWQQNRWNFVSGDSRFSRWDYIVNLEMQMELALGRKDLGYSLDI